MYVDQAVFVTVDQRPQQHTPYQGEDRSVRSDPQCQR